MKLRPGTIFKNRYEVLNEIGEGGFAVLYLCKDRQLERNLAVKVMKICPLEDNLARFQREAQLLGQLTHKNIVSIYSFDLLDDGSTPFIAMEYLEGRSLQVELSRRGKLNFEQLLPIWIQCCEGLEYAHNAGVVHRDLSPANIFLVGEDEKTQSVKLLDFGLSKIFNSETSRNSDTSGKTGTEAALTETGMLMGNPPYMSPELGRGMKVDARSDIYSLGCVFYESASGNAAFEAESPMGVLYQQQSVYPPEPQIVWNDESRAQAAKSILLKCLQKNPDKRFQSCSQLIETLTELQENKVSLLLSDLEPWAGSDHHFKSTREPALLRGFAVLVLAVSVVVLIFSSDSSLALIADLFRSLDSPTFYAIENSFATDLARRHKSKLAGKVFEHLYEISRQSNDSLNAAEACLDAAKTCVQRKDKREFAVWFLRTLQESTKCSQPDNKSKLLSRAFDLLLSMIPEGNSSDLLDLQIKLFNEMLSAKINNKTELRRCFDSITTRECLHHDLSAEASKALVPPLTEFLKGQRPVLSIGESEGLSAFSRHLCNMGMMNEAEQLWRARIANASNSKVDGSGFILKYDLACYLCHSKPDETLVLLADALKDESADSWDLARTWCLKAQIYLENKKDHEMALKCCKRGLDILADAPLVTYHRGRNSKGRLYDLKVRILYELGRTREMNLVTKQMIAELLQGTPETDTSAPTRNIAEDAIEASIEGTKKPFLELIRIFQKSQWVPCFICLRDTRQTENMKILLLFLQGKFKNEGWIMHERVQEVLRETIGRLNSSTETGDIELVGLAKKMLKENNR